GRGGPGCAAHEWSGPATVRGDLSQSAKRWRTHPHLTRIPLPRGSPPHETRQSPRPLFPEVSLTVWHGLIDNRSATWVVHGDSAIGAPEPPSEECAAH